MNWQPSHFLWWQHAGVPCPPPCSSYAWLGRADLTPPPNPGESTDLEIGNRTFYCLGCDAGGACGHATQARRMTHSSEGFAGTVREKNPVPVLMSQLITPGIHCVAMKESGPYMKSTQIWEVKMNISDVRIQQCQTELLSSLLGVQWGFLTQFQLRPQRSIIL